MFGRKAKPKPLPHPYLDRKESAQDILKRLELDVSVRLDGLLHGHYQGLVAGHGTEPGETREYAPGDDVRRIDWNVTARMTEAYVRQTIADRELETAALIDMSPSVDFGTVQAEKRDLVVAATAAIGLLTMRVGNRFGAEVLTSDGIGHVPARSGRNHVMALLDRLINLERTSGSTVTLAQGINALRGPHRRRGLRVIISDFLDTSNWQTELRLLATNHEVIAIEITDPREMELPDVGYITVIDPESGRVREVSTSSKKFRNNYREAALQQRGEIAAALRAARTAHLQLSTDRDWLMDVVRFVALRQRIAGAAS